MFSPVFFFAHLDRDTYVPQFSLFAHQSLTAEFNYQVQAALS